MANPYIYSITLPNGNTYDIKDAEAREMIAALEGSTSWLGITTTALTDGATTNPVVINGENVTALTGGIVSYNNKEFIFNGTAWQEFGDLSVLGTLAYKNSASGEFTPAGTVSQPTFTGDAMTATGTFTPSGSVSQPTFTGSEVDVSVSGTPAGTVSTPTFTGDTMTSTGNFTPAGTITMGVDAEGTANYTPAGSVAAPTISVDTAGTTTSITPVTNAGTLPSATMPTLETTVVNEVLTLNWTAGSFNAGALPTLGSAIDVKTGDASYTATAPAFSGTAVSLKGTFSGTQGSVSVSGTPEGTVSQPTFSGSEMTATGKVTAEGTVSQPTFSGTQGDLSVSGTPEGTVSQPTFSGTQGTVTVS